jgi:hypothetical protein
MVASNLQIGAVRRCRWEVTKGCATPSGLLVNRLKSNAVAAFAAEEDLCLDGHPVLRGALTARLAQSANWDWLHVFALGFESTYKTRSRLTMVERIFS